MPTVDLLTREDVADEVRGALTGLESKIAAALDKAAHEAGERYLTITESFELLGMSRSTFDELKKRPDFPRPYHAIPSPRYRRSELLKFMERQPRHYADYRSRMEHK